MVHDIIKTICDSFSLDIQEVFIYSILEGIFYSKIILSNGLEEVEIDCGVGDALALSVLFKCPIWTTTDILDTVGIIINDDGTSKAEEYIDEDDEDDDFDNFIDNGKNERIVSVDDLEKLMLNAIENEEYEIAAELRDRINKLKEK